MDNECIWSAPLGTWVKMTTATPVGETPFSLNVTNREEDFLYKSSGAIVAAIVVLVIIIFTVVLILLKIYNSILQVRTDWDEECPIAMDRGHKQKKVDYTWGQAWRSSGTTVFVLLLSLMT
ncbi:noncompact myelin-associated protein isoform X1 [Talpa occidentalis]|uniref:noncompact myelin-associated protein isoform X1 n=1 Tax=Talpa occidentalis TaxID=50954 RepID=UPI0023F9A606|nr:noncompact myelin-associated protein isoform X1 [Talpa occidentalis]